MFNSGQRRAVIETFVKYNHNYAAVIRELGYSDHRTSYNW